MTTQGEIEAENDLYLKKQIESEVAFSLSESQKYDRRVRAIVVIASVLTMAGILWLVGKLGDL